MLYQQSLILTHFTSVGRAALIVASRERAAPQCGTPQACASAGGGKKRPAAGGANRRGRRRYDACPTRPPQQRHCRCGGWPLRRVDVRRVAARRAPYTPRARAGRFAPMKRIKRLIPMLPARLKMDRLASTISGGKSVRWQRNHGLVGAFPAEAGAQHLGLPERTG